jgi:hypothetical protein
MNLPRRCLLWSAAALLAGAAVAGAEEGKRPANIVLIPADDLGWQDTGFTGAKFFETPHGALAENCGGIRGAGLCGTRDGSTTWCRLADRPFLATGPQRIYFLVNTSGEEISAGAAQSVGRGLKLT